MGQNPLHLFNADLDRLGKHTCAIAGHGAQLTKGIILPVRPLDVVCIRDKDIVAANVESHIEVVIRNVHELFLGRLVVEVER